MTIARRHHEALWEQMLASGVRALSSASGALELPVSLASRTERPKGKASLAAPVAAAHASCLAVALALVRKENRVPPEHLTVTAACTPGEGADAPRITTVEVAAATETSSKPGEDAPPSRSSSPWPRSREEAEVERIVRALRGYGVLPRAALLEISGAAHWSDSGFSRALARAVSTGRIRRLGHDLYETTES